MSDTLWHGKRYRLLNIIDEFNRELLHVKVDTSLRARRVIEALEQICEYKGYPSTIRVDNRPKFISTHLEQWCSKHNITLDFIRPGNQQKMQELKDLMGL